MDLLRERLKARGTLCAVLRGGGEDNDTTQGATTTTNNTDRRVAVQDGVVVGDGGSYSSSTSYQDARSSFWQDASSTVFQDARSTSTQINDNSNSSDAVIAMADMGADVIKSSGGAVVDLYKNAGAQNTAMWDRTLTEGGRLVDRLIDKAGEGFGLAEKVVDSFQPNENKNTDAIKTAAIAAGVIGLGALFLRGNK